MTPHASATVIHEAVRRKYAEVSASPQGKFPYLTGRAGAAALGYDLSWLDELPEDAIESFCGVGNPFRLGPIHAGEALLDVGCGSGFDLLVASRLVGPNGHVAGLDLTPEMIAKARRSVDRAGIRNADVRVAVAEAIPWDAGTFDVVVSNGVLNLSPSKEEAFREIHRVLRPGGRFQFADIVLKEELPVDVACSLEAWSD